MLSKKADQHAISVLSKCLWWSLAMPLLIHSILLGRIYLQPGPPRFLDRAHWYYIAISGHDRSHDVGDSSTRRAESKPGTAHYRFRCFSGCDDEPYDLDLVVGAWTGTIVHYEPCNRINSTDLFRSACGRLASWLLRRADRNNAAQPIG